jgi:hypothetical protein
MDKTIKIHTTKFVLVNSLIKAVEATELIVHIVIQPPIQQTDFKSPI